MLKEQYGIRAQLYVKRGWDQRRTNRNSINHAFLKIRSGFNTIILDFSYKQIAEGTQEKPDYLLVRYNNEHQRTEGLRQYGIYHNLWCYSDLANPEDLSQHLDP